MPKTYEVKRNVEIIRNEGSMFKTARPMGESIIKKFARKVAPYMLAVGLITGSVVPAYADNNANSASTHSSLDDSQKYQELIDQLEERKKKIMEIFNKMKENGYILKGTMELETVEDVPKYIKKGDSVNVVVTRLTDKSMEDIKFKDDLKHAGNDYKKMVAFLRIRIEAYYLSLVKLYHLEWESIDDANIKTDDANSLKEHTHSTNKRGRRKPIKKKRCKKSHRRNSSVNNNKKDGSAPWENGKSYLKRRRLEVVNDNITEISVNLAKMKNKNEEDLRAIGKELIRIHKLVEQNDDLSDRDFAKLMKKLDEIRKKVKRLKDAEKRDDDSTKVLKSLKQIAKDLGNIHIILKPKQEQKVEMPEQKQNEEESKEKKEEVVGHTGDSSLEQNDKSFLSLNMSYNYYEDLHSKINSLDVGARFSISELFRLGIGAYMFKEDYILSPEDSLYVREGGMNAILPNFNACIVEDSMNLCGTLYVEENGGELWFAGGSANVSIAGFGVGGRYLSMEDGNLQSKSTSLWLNVRLNEYLETGAMFDRKEISNTTDPMLKSERNFYKAHVSTHILDNVAITLTLGTDGKNVGVGAGINFTY